MNRVEEIISESKEIIEKKVSWEDVKKEHSKPVDEADTVDKNE